MPFKFEIFPVVKAQDLDSAAQPTFGSIDIGSAPGSQSSILIRSNTTNPIVGNRFKATAAVKTNTVLVNEVTVVVEFDPARLSVIDQDTANAGIQVKLLSDLFEIETISEDNLAQSGQVKVVAVAKNDTPVALNGDFIEIEFQAQSVGSTLIRIGTGVTGSSLTRQNGTKLTYQSNSVTLLTNSSTTTTTATTTTGTPSTTTTTTSTTGTTGGTGGTIPNTAIDNPAGIIAVFTGFLMVITGIKLYFSTRADRAKN